MQRQSVCNALYYIFRYANRKRYFPPAKGQTEKLRFQVVLTFTFTRSAKWLILVARIVAYMACSEGTTDLTKERRKGNWICWNIYVSLNFLFDYTYHHSIFECQHNAYRVCHIEFRFAFEMEIKRRRMKINLNIRFCRFAYIKIRYPSVRITNTH